MKIRIIVERLPFHFILLGVFFAIYGLGGLIISSSYLLHTSLLTLGILMLTSWQEIIIDTKKQSIHEFNRVCGFRLKDNSSIYTTISSIQCKEANYSQEYGKYNRWFLSGTLFRGYLGLDGQENLYLGENKIKKQMMKKLEKLANKLGVSVQDIPMNS